MPAINKTLLNLTCATATLMIVGTALFAQPVPKGQLTGTVGDRDIDITLDCSAWDNEEQSVVSLGDEPYRNEDANGDGIRFSFKHFAPVAAANPFLGTSAELLVDGQTIPIGPAFRAEDDVIWSVEENVAMFEGPSGAADDLPVTLTLDCAPRSPEDDGYIGRVTGTFDGRPVDQPLSCETWDDDMSTTETTPPGADFAVKVFLIRGSGQGTVEIETGGESYQLVAMNDGFTVTEDAITYNGTFRRDDDSRGDIALTFDCSARASLVTVPEILDLAPLPEALSPGETFSISLADIAAGNGDMIVITDGNPGWLFTAMRAGDDVTLTAPQEAGDYFVEYLQAPDMTPTARMEIVVE